MSDGLEIWKSIPGFPDYEASSFSRIRSVNRVVVDRTGRSRRWPEKVLSVGISPQLGYPIVVLRRNKETHTRYVHRLVWSTFVGPIPPDKEINHKDGDRTNNSIANLELVTHRENMVHSIKTGLRKVFVTSGRRKENPYARQ